MTIPNRPYVFQVAWDETASPRWEQPYVNYLGDLQSISLQRNVIHGTVQPDTLHIVALDPDLIVKPLKASSPLWPNVQRFRQCRLLARKPDLSFTCIFFGPLDTITSDSADRTRPTVALDIQSPLAAMTSLPVQVPALPAAPIWRTAAPETSALGQLLGAAQLRGPLVSVEPVGEVNYGGTWGGGQVQFGQALAELAQRADVVACIEFLLPATDADPHWRLRWTQPRLSDPPAVTWDWAVGDLEAKPILKYSAEGRT